MDQFDDLYNAYSEAKMEQEMNDERIGTEEVEGMFSESNS